MLIVKNASFSYLDKPVIRDISFTIHKGKNIALIGESGCGKSTLLKLIYGLYDLDHVRSTRTVAFRGFDGKDVRALEADMLPEHQAQAVREGRPSNSAARG